MQPWQAAPFIDAVLAQPQSYLQLRASCLLLRCPPAPASPVLHALMCPRCYTLRELQLSVFTQQSASLLLSYGTQIANRATPIWTDGRSITAVTPFPSSSYTKSAMSSQEP